MSMSTPEACEVILEGRTTEIVVATMSAMREVDRLSDSPRDLGCVPLMGGAAGLGLGLALAQHDEQVIVLDGDGSLLMQLGVLATIADAAPTNLVHVVFHNGVWFEGGGNIPVPSGGNVNFAGMAEHAGYAGARRVGDADALTQALREAVATAGPFLIELDIDPRAGARTPWSDTNPQAEIKKKQFTRMGEQARKVRGALL